MMKTHFLSALFLMAFLSLQTAVGGPPSSSDISVRVEHLSDNHTFVRFTPQQRYLLLPIEEKEEISRINVVVNNTVVQTFNVKLATDHIDYYVPLALTDHQGQPVVLDILLPNNKRSTGAAKDVVRWSEVTLSDTFDLSNREQWRPTYHHTPAYGWMNDPNGMFYKDGVYHLYYQHNPYGSQWENMTWGHSTSRDLVNWKFEGEAILPDAYGTIFSGSAVVDHNNTAGFGKGAVVAMYTSAKENQTQCLAYSLDDGKTFIKYEGNPIITAPIPDFRDPHIFWHEPTQRWVVLLAAGQEMWIYTSTDLKHWNYESKFGATYGNHEGVWECPDLMKLPVRGTDKEKWMLICNINPGGPFGGSATQYFVGDFDGKTFTCDSKPEVTKWIDYGKDHYAAVTFDNAPDNRRILMTWMSNWQYANQVPTKQYRSANAIPVDLDLYEYNGEIYVARNPSPELLALRGKAIVNKFSGKQKKFAPNGGAYEVVVDLKPSAQGKTTITLSNEQGEQVPIVYDAAARTLSVDRTHSGKDDFSDAFKTVTTAPVHGQLTTLRIFVDKSSIEVLDAEGKVSLTNIVFPTSPYHQISLHNEKGNKTQVTIFPLGK